MWCAAETVAKACERTGFEIHSHVGNAPMEQLSGVCAVPAYRPPDGQGKKGLKEQEGEKGSVRTYRHFGRKRGQSEHIVILGLTKGPWAG
jgi:hypothetical protein